MPISLIQTITGTISGGSILGTFLSNVTAGNCLIVGYARNANTNGTITDNTSCTWGTAISLGYNGVNRILNLFYSGSAIGGSTIITVNNGSTRGTDFIAREYSGLVTTSVLDKTSTGTISGSFLDLGTTATISQGSELVIGIGANTSTGVVSGSAPYGNFATALDSSITFYTVMQDLITSSMAAQTGTIKNTLTDSMGGAIATFRANQNIFELVQSSGTAVLGAGSTSAVWGANTKTGNLIVVGVTVTNALTLGTVTSITDAQSNTYIKAVSGTVSEATSVIDTELWYCPNIVGGAGSVTVNHTIDNCSMFVREYSGNFNYLDGTAAANGSSTTPNSGTVASIAQANELIVVVTGDDKGGAQTWTAAGNYGDMVGTATTLTGLSMEDNIVNATGAQTGTLTLGASANWESLIATFRRASNPGLNSSGMGNSMKPNI